MIIRFTAHRTSTEVVVVHAGPELAEFMGAFPGARWQAKSKTYWLPTDQLEVFGRHAARCGHVVVDDRKDPDSAEKFTGPLPECSDCGFAAARAQSLALARCPGCGVVWRPRVYSGALGPVAVRVDCTSCGRSERAGLGFCGQCGTPLPLPAGAPRPPELEPQAHREDPTLFAEAVPEHLEDGVRDHMQRAAGDR